MAEEQRVSSFGKSVEGFGAVPSELLRVRVQQGGRKGCNRVEAVKVSDIVAHVGGTSGGAGDLHAVKSLMHVPSLERGFSVAVVAESCALLCPNEKPSVVPRSDVL